MVSLYAVAQSNNGRVANTCNISEDWVGYATRYGDGAGDFSPLSGLTVQEVKAIGRHLGLPEQLVEKVPIDGLCGKTDEDNLGFSYAVLDRYIRTGEIDDPDVKAKIDRMHRLNLYKLSMMPAFDPGISTAKDALCYYCIVANILGRDWLCRERFRFGVSRLGNSLMSAIEQKTVSYF